VYFGQFNPPNDWLIELFFPKDFIGTCVEVGAVDGVRCSNTLHFEQAGWQCLCIEPNPHYHEALGKNRKLAMPYAISDKNLDGVPLFRFKVAGEYDALTGLAVDPRLEQALSQDITQKDHVQVNVRTLDTCLEAVAWSHVDLATIDTEGTELSVLRGFNLGRWKPRLLVVENNFNTPEVEEYLKPRGYVKAIRYEVNDFFLQAHQI
jgi:FkbM family methyltransferase